MTSETHFKTQKFNAVWGYSDLMCSCVCLLAALSCSRCDSSPERRCLMARPYSMSRPPSVSAHSCTALWSSTCNGSSALEPRTVGENQGLKIFSQITYQKERKDEAWDIRMTEWDPLEGREKLPLGSVVSSITFSSLSAVPSSAIFPLPICLKGQNRVPCVTSQPQHKASFVPKGRLHNGVQRVTSGLSKWSWTGSSFLLVVCQKFGIVGK